MSRLSFTLLSVFAVLALHGCGDDDVANTGDSGSGTDTGADAGADSGTEDTGTSDAVDSFDDVTLRLLSVTINRPDGIGAILQPLINNDIEADALHVLIQMSDFASAWPADFQIAGNAGQAVDGGYTWYDGVTIDTAPATIDADGNFAGGPLSIIFPALEPEATEPLQIPVSDLALEGTLFEVDGAWAIEGTLAGAILASEIEDITVTLVPGRDGTPLAQLLDPDNMDYPVDAEEPTGWRLEAEILATEASFVAPE